MAKFSCLQVFTALLAAFFLQKRPTVLQWFFMALIFLGLVLTTDNIDLKVGQATTVINGVILTLVSCLFYSFNSVIAEHLLSQSGEDLELPLPTGK